MIFSWEIFLKIMAPIAAAAAIYFYAHDAGWKERDAKVSGEIRTAVDAAIAGRDEACKKDQKLIGGINDDLTKGIQAANDRYADAIGKLYDNTHNRSEGAGATGGAELHHGTPDAGRLYYADPAGARPSLDRSRIATIQARQLIGCQAYIFGITKPKEGRDGAK